MSLSLGDRQLKETGSFLKRVLYYKYFYILLVPVILFYIVFSYLPMYGVTLAFKEFRFDKGLFFSPWVGIRNFQTLFSDYEFFNVFKNTLIISFGKVLLYFPIPIIIALLLNEITQVRLKRLYQTVFTFPHFLSWIIVAGILTNILSDRGAYNQILSLFGKESMSLLTDERYFRWIIYISQIWKESGWDSIIYMAALTTINIEMYEAADIDGANRLQSLLYITWPGIKSTVCIMLILAIGGSMTSNFDQVFNLYNPPVYRVGDILDTYVYRQAFTVNSDFAYASAVGLFKSVICFLLVFISNFVVVKVFKEDGLV